jgi:hypothetical protein
MLWILFTIVLTISWYLHYYKRKSFEKHRGFVEFGLVLFAAFFAIYQVDSSTADFNKVVGKLDSISIKAKESTDALHSVDSSLSNLPQQLDNLSLSIKSLDDVINTQRDQLSATLIGLNGSILTFKNAVDSLVKRFNRKPLHKIEIALWETDTSRVISTIAITNVGSLLSKVYTIRFQIPSACTQNFDMPKSFFESETNDVSYYQADYSPQSLLIQSIPNRPRKLLSNISLTKGSFEMRIIIYYEASFGNDGTSEQIFQFTDGILKPNMVYPPN